MYTIENFYGLTQSGEATTPLGECDQAKNR